MAKVLFAASVSSHIKFFHLPFIKMLQAEGHRVEVACHITLPLEGLPVVRELPLARSPYHPSNIIAYRQLKHLLTAERYDLVHVHTPVAAFLTRLAARRLSTPVLYTAHGFHFYHGAPLRYRLLYYGMERLASRWTAGLIVINNEDLRAAKGFGLIEGGDLFYVPGAGIDLSRWYPGAAMAAPLETLPGVDRDTPVAACVAEFIPRKNHRLLLEAWQGVVRAVPQAKLLLAGDGPCQEQERRRALALGLQDSVLFLGYRPDVPSILARADAVALSSRQEGLPMVVMEAMAMARPVVVTDVRGSRDLVRDGVNGYVVSLDQPRLLGEALARLLRDRELAARMGETGREIVGAYSLEQVLPQMRAIYDRFLP